jgi:hypothetical protein
VRATVCVCVMCGLVCVAKERRQIEIVGWPDLHENSHARFVPDLEHLVHLVAAAALATSSIHYELV